jgi:pimeloyl-ACP methyl ester carboxylesterase
MHSGVRNGVVMCGLKSEKGSEGEANMISAAFPYQKKRRRVLGREMAYVEVGEGDPIVLLHGNPTSSYLWRNVLPHLQSRGRCIAPDLIGMGDSDKLPDSGPGSYRFVEHRRYLDALLEALDVHERVTLVVHERLAAGSGLATGARLPSPSHQVIASEMFVQQRQIAPAVAIAIFELSANLADRLALPRHLDGRHHPARMARNALIRRALMQGEVAVGVAGHAGHVTQHERLVRMNVVFLRRAITSRMAI